MTAAKQKLIIVESPAKARTISKFLGKGYKVEASQGHVCDLPKSQIGVDVDNDFALKYITIRGRGEILNRIRKEARTASQIYLATDPDREGEAISWHLSHVLNMDPSQPCRIEFHEVTKRAIQNALKSARPVRWWGAWTRSRPAVRRIVSSAIKSARCCGRRLRRDFLPAACSLSRRAWW